MEICCFPPNYLKTSFSFRSESANKRINRPIFSRAFSVYCNKNQVVGIMQNDNGILQDKITSKQDIVL